MAFAGALTEGDSAGRAAIVAAGFATPAARTYAGTDRFPAFGAAPLAPPIRADCRAKAFVDFQNDVCAKDADLAVQEGMRSIEHIKRDKAEIVLWGRARAAFHAEVSRSFAPYLVASLAEAAGGAADW